VIEMHEFVIAECGLKRVDNHVRSRAAMADNKVKKRNMNVADLY